MRQVGAKRPRRLRSLDGMTVDTGSGKEKLAAGPSLRVIRRRLFLFGYPFCEFLACMHDYAEQHVCVLHTAILRAIPNIGTGLRRLDPHHVFLIGNQISLAGELWRPETMGDIHRLELKESWPPLARLTDRHVKLIGSDDAKLRVADFPPPLVADHRDVERAGGRGSALYIVSRARRGQKKYKDDENGDHRPGEFDLVAAVDLRRFAAFILGPLPKPKDDIR